MTNEINTGEFLRTTLIGLRKIRGFAGDNIRPNQGNMTPQSYELLSDAELLGQSAAEILMNPSVNVNDHQKQVDHWVYLTEAFSHKYPAESLSKYSGADNEKSSTDRLYGYCRIIQSLPNNPVGSDLQVVDDYILDNGRSGLSISDIFDNQVVVFSPLSADYLTACMIQARIRQCSDRGVFRLKPLIFDRYLRLLAMPDYSDESLKGICWIRVFVENSLSDTTLKASLKATNHLPRSNAKMV